MNNIFSLIYLKNAPGGFSIPIQFSPFYADSIVITLSLSSPAKLQLVPPNRGELWNSLQQYKKQTMELQKYINNWSQSTTTIQPASDANQREEKQNQYIFN